MRQTSNLKSQSAMEYLMTYGWAILIIAVVLGALFQLGVFSGIGTPKAQPGNCQVVKVGSGITQTVSLAGECQGQEPEYVVKFSGSVPYIYTDYEFPTSNGINFTVSVWINPPSYVSACGYCGLVDAENGNNGWGLALWDNSANRRLDFWTQGVNQDMEFGNVQPNTWTFITVACAHSSGNMYCNGYINGVSVDSNVQKSITEPLPFGIYFGQGRQASNNDFIGGLMSNVQIYNASLSASEILALYDEGIGGAPIDPQHIIGWWPLNGDTKDYSGNNNNGQPTNVVYTSSWTSGYTAP